MKAKEFIIENKKSEISKPRNFVAKNAMKTTSGAGAHKDRKKAEKQGDLKHKKDKVPMEGAKSSGIPKGKEDKFHSELDKLVHKTFGASPDEKKEKKKVKEESVVSEKAVSKQQQKFMGMVYSAKKGEKPASKEVAKVASGMSKKAAKDFASTKHKGLPKKKED
jgi:hypothetical protein